MIKLCLLGAYLRECVKSSRGWIVVKAQILSHESHKVTNVNEDAVVL